MSEQIKTGKPDPAAEVPAKRVYESPRMKVLGRLRELTQGAKTAGTDGGASKARNCRGRRSEPDSSHAVPANVFRLRVTEPALEAAIPNAPYHEWLATDGQVVAQFFQVPGGYLLRFRGIGDFTVACAGEDIECRPAASVSAGSIRHTYINQVLPLALSRLGKLVFHASAVELGGAAVAFAGESGRGKSTLAASFATSGHPFLTDDGLVIEERGADYWVAPSHPSIRLWDDSQQALVRPDTPSAEPLSFTSKIRFLAGEDIPHCDEPRPLRHVYFLGEGGSSHVAIEPMTASEALIELVKHSFLLDIKASDLIASHFDRLSRLVAQRICFRLDYPRKFEMLSDVRQAILNHCG